MNNHSKIKIYIVAIAILFIVALFILPKAVAPNNVGYNNKNVTVRTNVTITHSKPDVLNVTIYEAINITARNVTITAGSTKTVVCNATVRSWEGFADIVHVNASLYHLSTSNSSALDNNNSHYTNASCTVNASTSSYVGWYACTFDVIYYANNGTWA